MSVAVTDSKVDTRIRESTWVAGAVSLLITRLLLAGRGDPLFRFGRRRDRGRAEPLQMLIDQSHLIAAEVGRDRGLAVQSSPVAGVVPEPREISPASLMRMAGRNAPTSSLALSS